MWRHVRAPEGTSMKCQFTKGTKARGSCGLLGSFMVGEAPRLPTKVMGEKSAIA